MASTGGAGGAASGEGTHSSGGNAESGSQSGGMKEGWLEKKGDVNTNWRERWFTLANGQLEYFVDKEVRDEGRQKTMKYSKTRIVGLDGCRWEAVESN